MTKKSGGSKSTGSKPKDTGMSATDHRKAERELYARARLHGAKADLIEAKNPPPKPKGMRGYPC